MEGGEEDLNFYWIQSSDLRDNPGFKDQRPGVEVSPAVCPDILVNPSLDELTLCL